MTTRIERSALLEHSAESLFELVHDIESYPVFMDGCVAAEVSARGVDWVEARLDLASGGLRQSLVTRNHLSPPGSIRMQHSVVGHALRRLFYSVANSPVAVLSRRARQICG